MVSSNESNSTVPSAEVSRLVEHLFRHEAGKMVAILTRIFGLEHLSLAEDVAVLRRAPQPFGLVDARFAQPRPGCGPSRKGFS
jgi:hypothetical protein